MTDAFSDLDTELYEEFADVIAESEQTYLERLRHIKNARPFSERLIWSLLNRISSLQPTKHPAGIKRAGKRTREKSLIETLLETQLITIPQEVTM